MGDVKDGWVRQYRGQHRPDPARQERNRRIYEGYKAGSTQASLARHYGLAKQTIWEIIRREEQRGQW